MYFNIKYKIVYNLGTCLYTGFDSVRTWKLEKSRGILDIF